MTTIEEIITLLNIDTLTLAVGGVVVLIALAAAFLTPFRWNISPANDPEDEENDEAAADQPAEPEDATAHQPAEPLTVLLTPHDNVEQLERNLDAYLTQDYPDFRVIVVTWKGDHETDNLLKRYARNPRLYTTYIPDSSRYMPREKLAVTLGVKAAKTEWVVLADIACRPDSTQWLRCLAAHCAPPTNTPSGRLAAKTNLVVSHTRYEDTTPSYRRFERLYKELYLLREARQGQAYRTSSGCLAFRKSEFLREEGYRGNLKYLRGEFDFLVNKYARPGSLALALDRRAWMTEEEPTDKAWRTHHLFYMANRRHLLRSASHRLPFCLHQWALHLPLLLSLAVIALGALTLRPLMAALAAVALLLHIGLRTALARRALSRWGEPMPLMAPYAHELRLLWTALALHHRYRKSDKNDFISHKL